MFLPAIPSNHCVRPLYLSSTEHSATAAFAASCFGRHLSLVHLRCHRSLIVRWNTFIIRMATSMPTAYVSSTSDSLCHCGGVGGLSILSGLFPSRQVVLRYHCPTPGTNGRQIHSQLTTGRYAVTRPSGSLPLPLWPIPGHYFDSFRGEPASTMFD